MRIINFIFGAFIALFVISGVFALLGAVLGLTFGIIGVVFGFVWKIVFSPIGLIVLIIWIISRFRVKG